MRDDLLDTVAENLFTIPPLIGRSIRRRMLGTGSARDRDGLSPPHFEILKTLEEAGTLRVTEIGTRLVIPRPRMTQLLDRLADSGLAERRPDRRDRRVVNIALTRRGRAFLRRHDRLLRDAIRRTLSSLTDEELEGLSISLRRLRETFQQLLRTETTTGRRR